MPIPISVCVGGDIRYSIPLTVKSGGGGTCPPCSPPNDAHDCSFDIILNMPTSTRLRFLKTFFAASYKNATVRLYCGLNANLAVTKDHMCEEDKLTSQPSTSSTPSTTQEPSSTSKITFTHAASLLL